MLPAHEQPPTRAALTAVTALSSRSAGPAQRAGCLLVSLAAQAMSRYSDPALPLPAPRHQPINVTCYQHHLPGEQAFTDRAPSAASIAKYVRHRKALDPAGLLEFTVVLGSHWPRLLLEVRRVEQAALRREREKLARARRKLLLQERQSLAKTKAGGAGPAACRQA